VCRSHKYHLPVNDSVITNFIIALEVAAENSNLFDK
jgi:hypothetical protein